MLAHIPSNWEQRPPRKHGIPCSMEFTKAISQEKHGFPTSWEINQSPLETEFPGGWEHRRQRPQEIGPLEPDKTSRKTNGEPSAEEKNKKNR